MDPESRLVYERMQLYDLLTQHPDWSQRQYARCLGHDPKWVRKWKQRLQTASSVTLSTFRSASRAPKSPPHKVTAEAKALVAQLRTELSERYHRRAGAQTILGELRQYQQTHHPPFALPRARSTITQILHERGYLLPPKPRWHEPLELPEPNEEWEMDFGEVLLGDGQVFEFFLVVDRGTSRLVHLEGGSGDNAESALEVVARLLLTQGLPRRLRFDRGSRLWGAWTRDSYPSPLVRFLRVLGVEPVICPPRRPDQKPFVKRCIYTFKYEWLARFSLPTLAEALDASGGFAPYYNQERPHQGRACQNRPPDQAFPNLPRLPAVPEQLHPDAWLNFYHGRVYRRHVNSAGTMQVDRHTYFVGSQFAKQAILAQLDAQQACLWVSSDNREVKRLPLQGLYHSAMDFETYLIAMPAEARLLERHRQLLWERQGTVE